MDYIFPACLGLENNPLDEHHRNDIDAEMKRKYFADMLGTISEQANLPFIQVLKAFLGPKGQEYNDVKKSIEHLHARKMKRSGGGRRGPLRPRQKSASPPKSTMTKSIYSEYDSPDRKGMKSRKTSKRSTKSIESY